MKARWSSRAIRHLVALRERIEKNSEQNAALVARRIWRPSPCSKLNLRWDELAGCSEHRELGVPGTPYIIPYRMRRDLRQLLAFSMVAKNGRASCER